MQWWNDFVDWFFSNETRPLLFSAAVLALAVIISGLLAAWIARGAVRGLITRTERDQKTAAIAALVDAATEASVWNSLTPQEQVLSDRAVGQADILVRLLPIKGAGVTANWAAHQLAELKRNSATFGYQLDPAVAEFRDRLVEWQEKPGRARKAFQADLERWRFDVTDSQRQLVTKQDEWVAQQHHEQFATSPASTSAASTPAPRAVNGDRARNDAASTPTVAVERPVLSTDPETQRLISDVEAIGARNETARNETARNETGSAPKPATDPAR